MDAQPPNELSIDDVRIESPFLFQVAGHGAILKATGGKVCKPFNKREADFYNKVGEYVPLHPFLAIFHGTVELDLSSEQIEGFIKTIEDISIKEKTLGLPKNETSREGAMGPWSRKIAKNQFLELLQKQNHRRNYLILEDLTFHFKNPSVCDIKMGTRQHGDDASIAKQLHQQQKCAMTTSSRMGLRICGLQVYQPSSNTYLHMDKYEGRRLTPELVIPSLTKFFYNGSKFRADVIPLFLEKMKQLLHIVDTQVIKRFYSTSLLLVYEGNENSHEPKAEIKMIDFAHTHEYEAGQERDDGYILGLQNLINSFEAILQAYSP